jgi:hypothetical protein
MDLHLPEPPPQGYLIRRRQILISEQQELMIEEYRVDSRVQRIIEGLREIDTHQLGAECRTQWADLESLSLHGVSLGFD